MFFLNQNRSELALKNLQKKVAVLINYYFNVFQHTKSYSDLLMLAQYEQLKILLDAPNNLQNIPEVERQLKNLQQLTPSELPDKGFITYLTNFLCAALTSSKERYIAITGCNNLPELDFSQIANIQDYAEAELCLQHSLGHAIDQLPHATSNPEVLEFAQNIINSVQECLNNFDALQQQIRGDLSKIPQTSSLRRTM